MSTVANTVRVSRLSRLEWDSDHFGFAVGRIAGEATEEELHAALEEGRRRRFRLIYWATAPERGAAPWSLSQFNGRLVDRKITFGRPLPVGTSPLPQPSDISVRPYTDGACSGELSALAVAAGAYSRFAVDPRIPQERFEALYRIWIERSVSGEIADAVLVGRGSATSEAEGRDELRSTSQSPVAGMVTVKIEAGVGNIGLIAVAAGHRGHGIGGHLIQAAHSWMVERGAVTATVVTQSANAAACRLYERAGYSVIQAENYYHFWPCAGADSEKPPAP